MDWAWKWDGDDGPSNIARHTIGLGLSYQPYQWAENDGRQGINKLAVIASGPNYSSQGPESGLGLNLQAYEWAMNDGSSLNSPGLK